MVLTSRSWRLGNLETPDFSQPANYVRSGRPRRRQPATIQRAARFLKLLRTPQWKDFLTSRAEFDTLDDRNWRPDRTLGAGSFGEVASWRKVDNNGNVIDEVAVKSVNRMPTSRWNGNPALTNEAVMHREINLQNSENVIHLRAYKAFAPSSEALQRNTTEPDARLRINHEWRMYEELAPYGDLESLISKYRYWRTFLPEAFLWHIFDSLAHAVEAMRVCSPGNELFGQRYPSEWDDTQPVNLDIKCGNVMLGYPDHRTAIPGRPASSFGGSRLYNYPVIKLIDFDATFFTATRDARNPINFLGYGTAMNQPPEQIHYGSRWPMPGCGNADYNFQNPEDLTEFPPSMLRPDYFEVMDDMTIDQMLNNTRYDFRLLEKVHVWAVGKILFEALVLEAQRFAVDDPYDPDGDQVPADMYWHNSTYSYQEFQRNNNHQLADFRVQPWGDTFFTGKSPYSQELLDLIRDCLKPTVADRIDVAELRRRTQAGMQVWDARYVPGCEDTDHKTPRDINFPKVYYRENEINLMPDGKRNINTDYDLYHAMLSVSPYSPDWVTLRPKWDKSENSRTMDEMWRLDPNNRKNLTDYQNTWITQNGTLMRRVDAIAQQLQPDPVAWSPTSTEDPSDAEFRLQIGTRTRGGRQKLSYRFRQNHPNPNSRANKKRLNTKNAAIDKAKNAALKFSQARSRNAVRRLEAAERAQRNRPPPPPLVGTVPAPPPPPPPPPAPSGGGANNGGNNGQQG